MTDEQHNKNIACTFFVQGVFQLAMFLLIFVIYCVVPPISFSPGDSRAPHYTFSFTFVCILFIQMLLASASCVAGYALLKRKRWARDAGIVAGILASLSVPIGTVVCCYSLWFFLSRKCRSVYDDWSAQNQSDPRQIAFGRESRWAGYHTDEAGDVIFHPVEPPDWR